MGYIIENKNENHIAWNATSQSWEAEDFDTFSTDDTENLTLPTNGKWVKVPWSIKD